MDIPNWKSITFFLCVALFGIFLFPTERELGLVFSQSQTFSSAQFYLEKQFHRDPLDLPNTERYLEALLYNSNYERLEQIGNKLCRKYPKQIRFHEIMAKYFENIWNLQKASEQWFQILKLNPSEKDIKDKLASYYLLNKKSNDLINFYLFMIKTKNVDRDIYFNLARLYSLEKKPEPAIKIYTELLARYPRETSAQEKLAQIYEFIKKPEKALELYELISKAHPDDISYAMLYVEKLLKYKKDKTALVTLETFSKKFINDDRFLMPLIELYSKYGKKKEALALLQNQLVKDSTNSRLLRSLGEIEFEMENYKESEKYLRRYHEKTGGDYHSHHILGDVLDALGDQNGSRREYEKALKLIRTKS